MALATFWLGIDTIHGLMSKCSATNVGTEAINLITTGLGGQATLLNHHCLTAVRLVFLEMAPSSLGVTLRVFQVTLDVL
jgi:hypothetical protein